MSYILGMICAVVSILAAIEFLHLSPEQFFDDVAVAIVLGGTIAVAVIIIPWEHTRILLASTFKLLSFGKTSSQKVIAEAIDFIAANNEHSTFRSALKGPARDVLDEGKELISLGFDSDDIRDIMEERLHQLHERTTAVSSSVRSLAKYPPAFGLIGTVLGLVELMRAITDGLDPAETGSRMAIALMATLYGLIVANLIIAPVAESMLKRDRHEHGLAEIMAHAVVLAANETSIVKSQEILNSYLPKKRRQDHLKTAFRSEEGAA